MRQRTLRRGVLLASVIGTAAGQILLSVPAHAALPAGQVAVTAAGSDTTEKMMNDISADLDGTVVGSTTYRMFNVPAFSATPYAVPGDTECTDVSWAKDPLAPAGNTAATKGISPFGSGAGRSYLVAQTAGTVTGGSAGETCVDVARSSSYAAPSGGTANLRFYAYALDSVTWATTSLHAPSTLTRQQITDIYDCVVKDWGALPGGSSGPIQRYFPQAGSGTRSFFISDVLVGKSSSYVPPVVAGCADAKLIEENKGAATASGPGIADADIDKAILPYSTGVWMYQESNRVNPTLDIRKGARLGGINNGTTFLSNAAWNGTDRVYAPDTAVYTEANVSLNGTPAYPGVRYVWNVLDSSTTAKAGYQGAFALLAFNNVSGGTKSPVCNGSEAGTIASNFFAPLSTSGGGSHNLAGASCRLWP